MEVAGRGRDMGETREGPWEKTQYSPRPGATSTILGRAAVLRVHPPSSPTATPPSSCSSFSSQPLPSIVFGALSRPLTLPPPPLTLPTSTSHIVPPRTSRLSPAPSPFAPR